jgi:hypothetical protein
MATVPPLRGPTSTDDTVLTQFSHLLRLELELGVAEARDLLASATVALAVAVPATVTLLASVVVLIAAAFAPVFGAHWQHLVIAGGGVALLSSAAITWGVRRLRNLHWPKQTLTSFEENWRWLGAQLRSRLTLR